MRSIFCSAVAIVYCVLPLFSSIADVEDEDCLYSEGGQHELPAGCENDPLNLISNAKIKSAITAIAVPVTQIQMIGCQHAAFRTSMTRDPAGTLSFRIIYPILSNNISQDYVAPITHELGHVIQLKSAGSLEALRANLANSSQRIELGADFLVGILYRRYMSDIDLNEFQANLKLIGDYGEQTHGNPAERAAAFRYGFFYPAKDSIGEAANDFQSNIFGEVVEWSNP